MAEFNVAVREDHEVHILNLKGYLDAHTAPELESAFSKLINDRKYKVVVNFEDLNYISSAGLGVFMEYIETLRENNGDMKFASMNPKVYDIFDLLGFPMIFEFYKEETEAVNQFNQKS